MLRTGDTGVVVTVSHRAGGRNKIAHRMHQWHRIVLFSEKLAIRWAKVAAQLPVAWDRELC